MGMFTSQLSLLGLQVSLGTGLAIDTLPSILGPSQVVTNIGPLFNTNGSSLQPFNATLGDPAEPFDVLWAQNRYVTTFHSYAEPRLPYGSFQAFIDQAIFSLNELKHANHAKLDDPVPGGVFQYQSKVFSSLTICFRLALDTPGAAALTYYETGGVIASLAPFLRKWTRNPPASALLELWKGDGAMSEQKASGYIYGLPNAAEYV